MMCLITPRWPEGNPAGHSGFNLIYGQPSVAAAAQRAGVFVATTDFDGDGVVNEEIAGIRHDKRCSYRAAIHLSW